MRRESSKVAGRKTAHNRAVGGLLSSERREREREKDRGEGRLLRLEYLPVSSVTSRIMHGMMVSKELEEDEETRGRPRTFTPVEMGRGRG